MEALMESLLNTGYGAIIVGILIIIAILIGIFSDKPKT
jgi:hypothetical protein